MSSRICKALLCMGIGLLCGCATTKAKPHNPLNKGPFLKMSWLSSKTTPQSVEIQVKSASGLIQKQNWTEFENEPYEWDGFNLPAKSIFYSGWFRTPGKYTFTVCSPKCDVEKTINLTGKELKITAALIKREGKWSDNTWSRYLPTIKGVSLQLLPKKRWSGPVEPVFNLTNNSNKTVCSLGLDGSSGYFEILTPNGWRVANTSQILSDSGNYLILKKGEDITIHEHLFSSGVTNLSRKNLRFAKAYRTGECLEFPSNGEVWDIHIVTVLFKPLSSSLFRRSNTTTS